MACKYTYNGQTYTKDKFYSLVATTMVQPKTVPKYNKVLFPTGNTASKVEGHTTLEEFKKQKEDRIKELQPKLDNVITLKEKNTEDYLEDFYEQEFNKYNTEINQLKQELERVETEGFAALRPIYNFYENTVANILKKQGYNPIEITDEYGNKWNEVTLNQARDLANILLQRNEANQIIGQANIKAMTVLIDAVNQRSDTIPHEYAHHYIAWFRNTPIVQEAIKKWGSEEALVQSIGEQVVKQKGEAYNWWNKFVKWIMNQFNSLSKLQKEELTQILTDAFLTRQDLGSKADIQGFKDFTQGKQFQKLTAEEKAKTIEQVTKEHRSITALKDLAAKLAHRIGGKVEFENRTDVTWKGYNQGMTSVLNEAYMTSDTPFHEILAHPIIRAIKNKNLRTTSEGISDFSQSKLYQSLLKELETGRGKEVFEQVKRDYKYKNSKKGIVYFSKEENKWKVVQKNKGVNLFNTEQEAREFAAEKYTLEEQQEEAIVTLLSLMAADKLDAKKDATLISKLKELWKQISDFVKSLLRQDGIKIDELPISTTLNDLAEIMAYGNNKIILPGYKVEYSTPLGNKYDTLEEVNNEIRGLSDTDTEVDLSGVKINKERSSFRDLILNKKWSKHDGTGKTLIVANQIYKGNNGYFAFDGEDYIHVDYNTDKQTKIPFEEFISIISKVKQFSIDSDKDYLDRIVKLDIDDFIEKNKEYEQSKEIIEQWKKENNIVYDPEEVYSRGQGFYSSIGAYSNLELDLLLKNLIQHIEDNKKAGGEFTISAFTKPIDKRLKHIEGTGDRVRFVIYPKSNHIKWAAPTDVFSGSVWDANTKVSKDKKSELLGVSYTKSPSLNNINKVSPNLADIIDNLSHVHNELGIELTTNNFRIEYDDNIDYSTKKLIDNINKILDDKYGKLVEPVINNLDKNGKSYSIIYKNNSDNTIYSNRGKTIQTFTNYNEANKFYLENKDIYLPTGRIELVKNSDKTKENTTSIESVKNKTLNIFDNSKYVHPELGSMDGYNNFESDEFKLDTDTFKLLYNVDKKTYNVVKKFPNYWQAVTKSNLEYYSNIKGVQVSKIIEEQKKLLNEKIEEYNKKEYTSQALTNLKVAALKEVARKYSRSLITSKVVPINPNLADNNEIQYSKRESNSNTIDRLATPYSQMFEDENTDLDNALKEKKLLEYLNKQIKYIDEEGNECAEFGLKTGVSGTNWRIEENLNWGKKHNEGGIDLTMTDDGIVFRRNNSDIMASHGLVIKAEDGLVMPDESSMIKIYKE